MSVKVLNVYQVYYFKIPSDYLKNTLFSSTWHEM